MSQHAELRSESLIGRHAPSTTPSPQASRWLDPWSRRIAVGAIAFAVAFVVDVATGQQRSMVLGGAATGISTALLLLEVLRRTAPLLLYSGVWLCFNLGRAFADDFQLSLVGTNFIAHVEEGIFGRLPSAAVQGMFFESGRTQLFDVGLTAIHLSFFVTPFLTATILFVRAQGLFQRYTAATALCFAGGVVGFTLLPTAPPWLLASEEGGTVIRIADHVVASSGLSITEPAGRTSGGYVFEPNHLASIPSIHVAAVALIACAAWSARLRGAHIAVAGIYWLLMAVAVIYLGEHYVLDMVAGTVFAMASWWAAGRLTGQRRVEHR